MKSADAEKRRPLAPWWPSPGPIRGEVLAACHRHSLCGWRPPPFWGRLSQGLSPTQCQARAAEAGFNEVCARPHTIEDGQQHNVGALGAGGSGPPPALSLALLALAAAVVLLCVVSGPLLLACLSPGPGSSRPITRTSRPSRFGLLGLVGPRPLPWVASRAGRLLGLLLLL